MLYSLKMDGVPTRWDGTPWRADYCTAAKFEAAIAPWRGRPTDPKPIGTRSKANVKRVERLASGDIVFSLWNEPAVTFHPDGDISVAGWPSVSRGMFVGRLVPQAITYVPANDSLLFCKDGEWPRYWSRGTEVADTHAAVLKHGETVRLTHASGRWWPKNEAALSSFSWVELDRNAARALMREHPLRDFKAALNAYQALLPGKMELTVRNYGPGIFNLLDQIEEGDFATAIALMPITRVERWINGRTERDPPRFSTTTLTKLRQALYVRSGVARRQEASILPIGAWRPKIKHNPYTRWETGQ